MTTALSLQRTWKKALLVFKVKRASPSFRAFKVTRRDVMEEEAAANTTPRGSPRRYSRATNLHLAFVYTTPPTVVERGCISQRALMYL